MMQNKIVIGITGGVGCGKSTVLDILERDYGAYVIKADDVGKEIMVSGTCVFNEIVRYFGNEIVAEDGELNRQYLAEIIHRDESKRDALNAIVHPAVIDIIKDRIEAAKNGIVVLETAIMFETGVDKLCDCIWAIITNSEIRRERLIKDRGYTSEKVDMIAGNQLKNREFVSRCDYVIENDGNLDELGVKIRKIMKILCCHEG